MATIDQVKQFPSDNKTLSFEERVKLAMDERGDIQKEYTDAKRKEAMDIVKTLEDLVEKWCDKELITQKIIRYIHRNKPNMRRKTIELYTYDNKEDGRKEIQCVENPNKRYSAKYMLSGQYMRLLQKYTPDNAKTLEEMLQERINTEEFNNGIDHETGEKMYISVFHSKGQYSKFKNGVYLSRDGIHYT